MVTTRTRLVVLPTPRMRVAGGPCSGAGWDVSVTGRPVLDNSAKFGGRLQRGGAVTAPFSARLTRPVSVPAGAKFDRAVDAERTRPSIVRSHRTGRVTWETSLLQVFGHHWRPRSPSAFDSRGAGGVGRGEPGGVGAKRVFRRRHVRRVETRN